MGGNQHHVLGARQGPTGIFGKPWVLKGEGVGVDIQCVAQAATTTFAWIWMAEGLGELSGDRCGFYLKIGDRNGWFLAYLNIHPKGLPPKTTWTHLYAPFRRIA